VKDGFILNVKKNMEISKIKSFNLKMITYVLNAEIVNINLQTKKDKDLVLKKFYLIK
jgi:hypothetical protein